MYWSGGWRSVGYCGNGKKEGLGRLIRSDGQILYTGFYRQGKRHGYGEETDIEGEQYKGMWENDRFSGKGTRTFPNGNKKEGNWQGNKLNGFAMVDNEDGNYEGQYKDYDRRRRSWCVRSIVAY